jgi:uncharacterized protein with PIN domain
MKPSRSLLLWRGSAPAATPSAIVQRRADFGKWDFAAAAAHAAALNLGDRFSYALRRSTGESRPSKGAGFPPTDLLP